MDLVLWSLDLDDLHPVPASTPFGLETLAHARPLLSLGFGQLELGRKLVRRRKYRLLAFAERHLEFGVAGQLVERDVAVVVEIDQRVAAEAGQQRVSKSPSAG